MFEYRLGDERKSAAAQEFLELIELFEAEVGRAYERI